MKIKKKIIEFIYFFLNYKKKRQIFRQTYKCKLLSSKSFIFFANQLNKDLRSSTKFFIRDNFYKNSLSDLDIYYVGADALEDFVSQIKDHKKKFILITGDSDRTIKKSLDVYKILNKNKNLINWYSQNCINPNKKITQIPIGLDYISQFHNSHTFRLKVNNQKLLPLSYEKKIIKIIKKAPDFKLRNNQIFCNYQFSLKSSDRIECFNLVSKNLCFYLKKRIPYLENFQRQSRFKFVLAPFGEGIDTHRIWEAILLGNIPIVKSSPLDNLYKNFPVLIVKSWKDLKYEKLIYIAKRFNNKSYYYEKVLTNYWKAKIFKKDFKIKRLKNYKMFKEYILKTTNE